MKTVKLFEQFIAEGIHDKNILKAFFMAGGPGSGKSYVAGGLFGFEQENLQTVSLSTGLKIINSDQAFEFELKKMDINPKDLATMDPELFNQLAGAVDSPRAKAKRITNLKKKLYTGGRLGMVIDGTGDNSDSIARKKEELEELGYDTYMLFVNTSLNVALARNAKRSRSLPEDLVTSTWQAVQNNLGKFQAEFGIQNLIIMDNSEDSGPDFNKTEKEINKVLKRPIQNPIGKQWIKENQ